VPEVGDSPIRESGRGLDLSLGDEDGLDLVKEMKALSDRELQVFRLIGQSRTTRQIAGILNRSVKTIESHLEHIKNKLGIGSAAELAQRATQWVETGRIG
jgi:DNA-binding CsgD family transcriptional regulator